MFNILHEPLTEPTSSGPETVPATSVDPGVLLTLAGVVGGLLEVIGLIVALRRGRKA